MKENIFLIALFGLMKPLLNLVLLSVDTAVNWATKNPLATKERAANLQGVSVWCSLSST
jgi:hypothetical protein